MVRGALLENGGFVERPLRGRRLRPVGMLPDEGEDVAIIRLVIGAEVEGRTLGCACGHGREKFLVHHAILVMAAFRPGIREENEDRGEAGAIGHHGEKIRGVGADELEVAETRAIPLSISPGDSIRRDIDTYADLVGVGLGIRREEVAVPTSDFPDEARGRPYELIECTA
jgi:hypothetical protein